MGPPAHTLCQPEFPGASHRGLYGLLKGFSGEILAACADIRACQPGQGKALRNNAWHSTKHGQLAATLEDTPQAKENVGSA